MNRYFFLSFLIFLSFASFSQNWTNPVLLNRGVTVLYPDSIENSLFIGGTFKYADNIEVNGIVQWDGGQIKTLSSGRKRECDNFSCSSLYMILRFKNEIYIGDIGDTIEGIKVNGIARWDGTIWKSVGNGVKDLFGDSGTVWGGLVHGDSVYFTGSFLFAEGNPDTANSVAIWTGSQWNPLNFPSNFFNTLPLLGALEIYQKNLFVGGNSYGTIGGNINHDIAMFDGTTWHQVDEGLKGGQSDISDMVVYKDELYICGYFRGIDGNVGNKIMRWNGEHWKDVGGGLCEENSIASDMVVYNNKLYLVGSFNCVGNGLPANNIAVWDGEHWCSLGNSHFDNRISCITAWNNDIYIGGGFTEIDGQSVKYFAKWVGDHATDTCSAYVAAAPGPEQESAELTISPNPAHSSITLALKGEGLSGKLVRFSIFDPLGQEVWSVTFEAGRQEVSLAGWSPGVYVVRAELERNVLSRVFVKE